MTQGEHKLGKIQELFGNNLNILEEQIDMDVQTEYFQYLSKCNRDFKAEDVMRNREDIFSKKIPLEQRKKMLVNLASIDNIEALRTIERYIEEPDQDLIEWAKLALKESKLLLKSKFLDENQVLITTGIGGKGLKIRYFAALIGRYGKHFTGFQEGILRKELEFRLKRTQSVLERISFERDLCTLLVLVPLHVNVQELFDGVIGEVNQFGNFLFKNCLITNIKILSIDEVREFISAHHNQLD